MSYIGNTPTTQTFTPAVDYFSGNGSSTAFTLSRTVASVAQVEVYISNVPQTPGVAFTVSGNTITFTSAPPAGSSNIYVYYTSPVTQVIAPGQQTVGTTQLVNSGVTAGTYGSSSQIPAITVDATGRVTSASQSSFSSGLPGVLGQVFTSSGTFTIPSGVTALKVTVVGGGGAGRGSNAGGCSSYGAAGGGGGAGGCSIVYLTGMTPGNTISVTVGAAGGSSSISSGTQTITTATATAGSSSGGIGGGSGGSASGGTINQSGGGGSGGGGTNGAIGNSGGAGGASHMGGGGYGGAANGSGGGGASYGSGGGGAGTSNGISSGGAGAPGIVIFEW